MLRFGIVTDIHYTPEERAGITDACLVRCAESWLKAETSFVVQLGDLISREGPEAESDLLNVKEMLSRYPGELVHVPGNHCLAVPQDRLFRILGIPAPYYSFTRGAIRFVVLHGMEVSVNSEPETAADRNLLSYYQEVVQAPFYCGAIGSRQIEWLATELDLALQNREPVIVLSHLPLLEETSDVRHGLLWNHEEVSAIICRYPNVRACLSGHYHPGAYAFREGTHFIVLPAFVNCAETQQQCCCTAEVSDGRLRIGAIDGGLLYDLDFR
ncbi:MAG: metallophosphoesterase [Chlorobiaceae bacterium]|nr:metallophosphoesterase [Chlorobiaceae bacterium]NTW74982.1 metallophosphoesterase [Chlorobiaceae bacterium]